MQSLQMAQQACGDNSIGIPPAHDRAESDEGDEISYREAWTSRASGGQKASPAADAAPLTGQVADLKAAGNDAFAAGG